MLFDRPAPRLLGVDLAVLVLPIFIDLLLFFIGVVSMLVNKEAEPHTVDGNAKVSQTFPDVGCTYGRQRSLICGGLACNALGQHNLVLLSSCRQLIANACVSNASWRHDKTNLGSDMCGTEGRRPQWAVLQTVAKPVAICA